MQRDDFTDRIRAMTTEQLKAEISRQSEIIAMAIGYAISDAISSFETPIANAAIDALIAAEAQFLATLNDDNRRQSMARIDRMRPKVRAAAVESMRGQRKIESARRHDA